MPELNNAALYKNEDLLCTFILKVILLPRQGLGVGEVTSAKFLPGHPPWMGSDNQMHSLLRCACCGHCIGMSWKFGKHFLQYVKLYFFT